MIFKENIEKIKKKTIKIKKKKYFLLEQKLHRKSKIMKKI